MRKRLAASNRWTWYLAALCLVAGAFLAWQVWRSAEVARPSNILSAEEAEPAAGERQLASFQMPPAEEYEELVMRPLFNRSRRPETTQQAPQVGSEGEQGKGAQAAKISLNGVVLARGRRVALLRLDNDPKVMHVAEGQRAGGWLIETIRPDRIILRRGETASEVPLDYKRRKDGGGMEGEQPIENAPTENVSPGDEEVSE